MAFLTLKGRNRKASSIANGAYIYRNALLSAIVKQLTPEGQPQLLESRRWSFVSRCFAAATSKLSCAIRSLSIPSGASQCLIARCMLVRRSRASLCPGRFGAASGELGLVIEERTWLTKESRVGVRDVATESNWDEACRMIAEG